MSLAFRKKFKKYTCGMGLEHEMHLFHLKKNRKTNITSFTLYDGELARRRLLDEYNNDKVNISLDDLNTPSFAIFIPNLSALVGDILELIIFNLI